MPAGGESIGGEQLLNRIGRMNIVRIDQLGLGGARGVAEAGRSEALGRTCTAWLVVVMRGCLLLLSEGG